MTNNKLGPVPFIFVLGLLTAACIIAAPMLLIARSLS